MQAQDWAIKELEGYLIVKSNPIEGSDLTLYLPRVQRLRLGSHAKTMKSLLP
jgi:hypothetical protein